MRDSESFRRRRLPRWDVPDAAYFVTTCLAGSIPAEGWLDLEQYRRVLERRPRRDGTDEEEWRRTRDKLAFARLDLWLDNQPAVRHLADPALAEIVVDSMLHFAGDRYDLLAFVVMSSHIHWVFQPLSAWVDSLPEAPHERKPRQRIQQGLNGFTARRCNEARGARGTFWQRESYDHWIRDVDELARIINYVEGNPVKAGLVTSADEWRYSSAYYRTLTAQVFGEPLRRR